MQNYPYPLDGKISHWHTQRDTHTETERQRDRKLSAFSKSIKDTACFQIFAKCFLLGLTGLHKSSNHIPTKTNTTTSKTKSTAACIINTNKQTNKIGILETHGSHNHPFKATISRNSTTYHHSHHPSIASILHRPSLSSPLAKKKRNKKIKGRNNPIVRQSSTMQQCNWRRLLLSLRFGVKDWNNDKGM